MKKIVTAGLLVFSSISFAQPKSDLEAAKLFLRIFQKADTASLLTLLPPPSIYRMTAPDETKDKTDAEILTMAEPLRIDLLNGFRMVLQEADSLKIDRDKIKFIEHESVAVLNYPGFFGIRLLFNYGKKKGEFNIGAVFIEEKWYIYGIDQWQLSGAGAKTK